VLSNPYTPPTVPSILCIDDDADCLELRRAILERHGYRVLVYEHPLDALKQNLRGFDLILLDYEMPELNGSEVLIKLRSSSAICPVILVSGCVADLPWQTRRLFSACIQKGRPVEELLAVVERFLQQSTIPDPE
jgi:CheY-like chemotaxis protein